MTTDLAENLHLLYQEYRDRMLEHGCESVELTFDEWVNLV
jgi:hypothetical protein